MSSKKDKDYQNIKNINLEIEKEESEEEESEKEYKDIGYRQQKIEEILYEICNKTILDIKQYVYENSVPIAENLTYSDIYDFMRS